MDDLEKHKRNIIKAMKASGIYNKNLIIQIENLAASMQVRSVCLEKMKDSEFSPILMKITRDGEQPVENPILKTLSRSITEINRQMKQLKLTVEDIVGAPELRDNIDEMYEELNNIRI